MGASSTSTRGKIGALADLRWLILMVCCIVGVTALSDERIFLGEAVVVPTLSTLRTFLVPVVMILLVTALDDVLPGKIYCGPVTPCGYVPLYKDNAVAHCVATNAIFVVGIAAKLWPATIFVDEFSRLVSALNVIGLLTSAWLYRKGLGCSKFTDAGPTSNGCFHDIFWGVILYPRCFGRDVKRILNCRFSMTFWMLHGISCVAAGVQRHGELDPALVASAVSQWIYLFKFFWWEAGYMHSIDIILDNAGFYETWGVLVYVPAMYTVHTRALVVSPSGMSWATASMLMGISLVFILCNYLPDRQRQNFRSGHRDDDSFIEATYTIVNGNGETSTRTARLVCSGWWGWSRHPQYAFEMATAWTWGLLGCPWQNHGTSCLYGIFITCLLIQRAGRDEEKCLKKYGKHYLEYMHRVPWKILPWVW